MIFKNIIVKVCYILILVYLALYFPSLFGYKPLVVVSGSMEPTFKVGSIIYYKNTSFSNFNINDILVFRSKNHIVSHRIVEIGDYDFVTKGDANDSNDQNEVNMNAVLGKATDFCIPLLGYYGDFIYNHKYILIFIIFFIICDSIISICGKNKDEI